MADRDDEIETLLQERIEEAKRAWSASHPVQFAGAITADDVGEIVVLLAQAGVPPTVRAVRQVYGGGSPNVITPLLRNAWLHKELPQRLATLAVGHAVPTRLLQFWDLLVSDAAVEAKLGMAHQQRELDDMRAGLDAQMTAHLEEVRRLDDREAAQRDYLAKLTSDLELSRASERQALDAAAERTRLFEQQRGVLEQRDVELAARTAELAAARHEAALLQQRHAAETDQFRRDLAAANDRTAQARTETGLHAKAAQDLQGLLAQAQTALADATARADKLAVTRAELDLQLAAAQKDVSLMTERATSAAQRAEELSALHRDAGNQLAQLREAHATLQAAHDRRGSDLTQHTNALAQLRSELKILEHVKSDLVRMEGERDRAQRDRDQLLRHPPALLKKLDTIETLLHRLIDPAP